MTADLGEPVFASRDRRDSGHRYQWIQLEHDMEELYLMIQDLSKEAMLSAGIVAAV